MMKRTVERENFLINIAARQTKSHQLSLTIA